MIALAIIAALLSTGVTVVIVKLTRWHEAMLHRPRLSQVDQQQPGDNDPEFAAALPRDRSVDHTHNGCNAA